MTQQGGIYPAAHPLLLFSDLENADYNDLIRLAELIGNVKRTTATQAEVDQSGLKIVSAQELPELLASDRVLSNTVERCLVCLEDYEDAPDAELRLLECRHAFHRYGRVDRHFGLSTRTDVMNTGNASTNGFSPQRTLAHAAALKPSTPYPMRKHLHQTQLLPTLTPKKTIL